MEAVKKTMDRVSEGIRCALAGAATNTALFVFAAFLFSGVLGMTPLAWYQDQVTQFFRFVLVPWGMALTLAQLLRRKNGPASAEMSVLFVLLVWITVPYIVRFGLTFNNINAACGYAMVFFGIYAGLRGESAARRERMLDCACALFTVFSLVFGGVLLYCAATVKTFAADLGEFGFGIWNRMYLCSGVHYNLTGMLGVCCALMCLAGAERAKGIWMRLPCILGAVMMGIVIVLTQSRTARYALLLALAAGAFSRVFAHARAGKAMRAAAGVLAAAAVLVGGYFAAVGLCDAALNHYTRVEQKRAEQGSTDAAALMELLPVRRAEAEEHAAAAAKQTVLEARPPVDASFSARTEIWANLFRLWRENPKVLLIGNGVGRTGSLVVRGTSQESLGAIALHNTYLQFAADFGLIGFGLHVLFFLLILARCLRAYLRGGARSDGMLSLSMLVLAILAIGMMESAPLGEMTITNVLLFFALGILVPCGEREPLVNSGMSVI